MFMFKWFNHDGELDEKEIGYLKLHSKKIEGQPDAVAGLVKSIYWLLALALAFGVVIGRGLCSCG